MKVAADMAVTVVVRGLGVEVLGATTTIGRVVVEVETPSMMPEYR